jgi:hypothetical protein
MKKFDKFDLMIYILIALIVILHVVLIGCLVYKCVNGETVDYSVVKNTETVVRTVNSVVVF